MRKFSRKKLTQEIEVEEIPFLYLSDVTCSIQNLSSSIKEKELNGMIMCLNPLDYAFDYFVKYRAFTNQNFSEIFKMIATTIVKTS